jgi:prepilin peptidase CpaA
MLMANLALLQFSALAALLTAAVVMDVRERRIPNWVTVPGLLAGLVMGALIEGGVPVAALAGAGLALLVSFPLVALGGLGAGDSKLLTAVGAFVGAGGLLPVLVYGGIGGGVLAIINLIRRRALLGAVVSTKNLLLHWITLGRGGQRIDLDSPEIHTVPYGVAIAAGAILAWFFPFSLTGGV